MNNKKVASDVAVEDLREVSGGHSPDARVVTDLSSLAQSASAKANKGLFVAGKTPCYW